MSEKEDKDAIVVDDSTSSVTVVDSEDEIMESGESTDADAIDEAEADADTLKKQLDEAEAKAAEYLDGWQRSRAEFANAKKRLERERAEAYRNATASYVAKLLPILDDFERALEIVPDEIAEDSWFDGLNLVWRKISAVLDDLKVERIESVGLPFDPTIHEALTLVDVDEIESGFVVEEVQTGYRIGDRVIRPSLVNVAA